MSKEASFRIIYRCALHIANAVAFLGAFSLLHTTVRKTENAPVRWERDGHGQT